MTGLDAAPERPRRPAVFLDRDGTIIEDRGNLSDPSQVEFFADTVPALRRLCPQFDLFMVTNQSGVGQGAISMSDVERVNSYVTAHLARHGIRLTAVYVCPHERAAGCECIKPKPYFLRKAEAEHGIDLPRSFVVGDHPHDVTFGDNAGATGIYVLTGHGKRHRHQLPQGSVVTAGIGEAVEWILRRRAGACQSV